MKQEPNNTVVGAALAIGVKPQVLQDALYVLRADIPIAELIWDNSKLLAENERLRKAGDAMYDCAVQDSTGLWLLKPFEDWNAAKEGAAK